MIDELPKRSDIFGLFLLKSATIGIIAVSIAILFRLVLAGVIYVLEELRRNFFPYAPVGALAASVTADLVTRVIIGPLPTFRVSSFQILPLTTLPLVLLIGGLAGLLGAVFNQSLIRLLRQTDQLESMPRWVRAGANLVIDVLTHQRFTVTLALGLLILKFTMTIVSYYAVVSGGIILPLLTIGALLGVFVADFGVQFFPSFSNTASSMALIGMGALLSQ